MPNDNDIHDVSRPYEGNVQLESEPTMDYPSMAEVMDPPQDEPIHVVGDMPETNVREDVLWSSNQAFVGNDRATQLVGRDVSRRRLVVTNPTGGDTVYLLREPTQGLFTGYALDGGSSVEMLHNDAVWARCSGSDESTLSIVSEFVARE